MPVMLIKDFLKKESTSGLLLFLMAILAMLWANSTWVYAHHIFTQYSLFFINEGLMTFFFLLVGLELRRGFKEGELSSFPQISLPLISALGGMLVPAFIYVLVNWHNSITIQGWATPVATDIAFALAALSIWGERVPIGLKVFLLALAIFDDIGAIIILAFFQTHGFSWVGFVVSLLVLVSLFICTLMKVKNSLVYVLLGACLWLSLLKTGIHPTLTGVLLAFFIPYEKPSLFQKWEENLHPWVAFLIMPLFALANAGVSLSGLSSDILFDSVVLGIVLGLFIGKQLGIISFAAIAVKLGWSKLPANTTWTQLYSVAILCGIGFTMSLFLGTLSFQNHSTYLEAVRLGVLLGSLLSGLLGTVFLFFTLRRKG